ncbi:MAG: HNH endonuclease [Gemmatimonadota bacterium]
MTDAWYSPASEEHIARERARARELRRSPWWKNRLGEGRCYYCERAFHPSELTMDHIVPLVRGGRSVKANVVPCCRECNASKLSLVPVEWEEYLSRRRDRG